MQATNLTSSAATSPAKDLTSSLCASFAALSTDLPELGKESGSA